MRKTVQPFTFSPNLDPLYYIHRIQKAIQKHKLAFCSARVPAHMYIHYVHNTMQPFLIWHPYNIPSTATVCNIMSFTYLPKRTRQHCEIKYAAKLAPSYRL